MSERRRATPERIVGAAASTTRGRPAPQLLSRTTGTAVWRVAKVAVVAAIGAALLGASSVASTDTNPQHFMDLLKAHGFGEAAEEFYYEPGHTPLQVASDKANIARFMETLFLEIGDVQREAPLPRGAYVVDSWNQRRG